MALGNRIATALCTDVGKVRGNNEDSVAEDPEIGLLVLADGMGGYNAGEVASQIAVRTIVDVVRTEWQESSLSARVRQDGPSPEAVLLEHAVQAAHQAIFRAAQSDAQMAGMGTTVVAVLLHDNRMVVAHVGDSRLYRYRFGQLRQVTRDHSLLEELVAKGHFSREDAATMVRKNIVTRALGVDPQVKVDVTEEALDVGDFLLLCSDGLSDMVPDEAMRLSLHRYGDDLPAAAGNLVDLALAQGGKDNVSVILARVDRPFGRGRAWYARLLDWI
ncbi:Stp1/IreP family PP2C-type Ser/Thr phosphatase [Panacagrimonas sp.]|uniref:Stp1/IreP family PP2C-type Ser/Thr phosphatase n=1 Tax=Panacagrimonas sp. TaxID=2480088 RepID=UPI003B517752